MTSRVTPFETCATCSPRLPGATDHAQTGAVADLEQLALQRDRGFLVRLVLLMAAGFVVGAVLYGQLIGDTATGCLARTLGGAGPVPASAPVDKTVVK